jgi:hypothetical protein
LLKRQKLEEEGRDLSQLNEEIGVTAEQKELEWEQHEKTMREQHKIGDLSTVQSDSDKSLRFKLDRKLVLLVQQNFDFMTSPWILPQKKNSGETLRQVSITDFSGCNSLFTIFRQWSAAWARHFPAM